MIFVGIGISYWTPLFSMCVLLLPFFAYLLIIESKFVTHNNLKPKLFAIYSSMFAFLLITIIVHTLNGVAWTTFFAIPNYKRIIAEDREILKPAFTGFALTAPLILGFYAYVWIKIFVLGNPVFKESIGDTKGLKLGDRKKKPSPYLIDNSLGKNVDTGKEIQIKEEARLSHMLIIGPESMNKAENIIIPMIARDLKKKRFLEEAAKTLVSSLIKSNKATIKDTYADEDFSKNFTLEMVKSTDGNDDIFDSYIGDLRSDSKHFKNLGVTYISNNRENLDKIVSVAKNYNIDYYLVDPLEKTSYGINPFIEVNSNSSSELVSNLIAVLAKATLTNLDKIEFNSEKIMAIENISILLKETYPKTHEGKLPTIEDLQTLLLNFDLLQVLVENFKTDPDNLIKYENLIRYFENNYYKNSQYRNKMSEIVQEPISFISQILKNEHLKRILCNRIPEKNINFEKAISEGKLILITTRKSEMLSLNADLPSALTSVLFDLYSKSLVSKKIKALSALPNYLYIEDFTPIFTQRALEKIATFDKYNVGLTAGTINLNSIKTKLDLNTLLQIFKSNLVQGGGIPEDMEFISKHFGTEKIWGKITRTTDDSSLSKMLTPEKGGEKIKEPYVAMGPLLGLKPKEAAYKIFQTDGKPIAGYIKLDTDLKEYTSGYKQKEYDFEATDINNNEHLSSQNGPITYY